MEVVIIMGLFDKFKKKEDVQQIKTDEQRELENIVQQIMLYLIMPFGEKELPIRKYCKQSNN